MVSSRVAIEKEYKNYFFPDMGKVLFGFYSLVALTGLATSSMLSCLLFVTYVSLICLEGISITPVLVSDVVLFRSSQQLLGLVLRPLKGFLS